MKKCLDCDKMISDDALFCPHCGNVPTIDGLRAIVQIGIFLFICWWIFQLLIYLTV